MNIDEEFIILEKLRELRTGVRMHDKMLVTEGVGCPKCGSKNIEQVPTCEYPFMHCKTCDEIYWSE